MTLTDAGESRIRGYLFVLGRSLRSFLPREVAEDAVREVESHIRERIEQTEAGEDSERRAEAALPGHAAKAGAIHAAKAGSEREIVEHILAELGPPLRVAQAYSHEMTLDEAVTTGRFVPMARALWHLATTSVLGFLWGVFFLVGWAVGLTFLALALLKPIFPNNVGLMVMKEGVGSAGTTEMVKIGSGLLNFGAFFPVPPGTVVYGGYWVIPICLVLGFAIVVFTVRASRRMLAWIRSRKSPARLRLRVEVEERPE